MSGRAPCPASSPAAKRLAGPSCCSNICQELQLIVSTAAILSCRPSASAHPLRYEFALLTHPLCLGLAPSQFRQATAGVLLLPFVRKVCGLNVCVALPLQRQLLAVLGVQDGQKRLPCPRAGDVMIVLPVEGVRNTQSQKKSHADVLPVMPVILQQHSTVLEIRQPSHALVSNWAQDTRALHTAPQCRVMVISQGDGEVTCSLVIPIQIAPPRGARATGHFQMWLAPSYRRSFPSSQKLTYPSPDVLHEVWPVQQS